MNALIFIWAKWRDEAKVTWRVSILLLCMLTVACGLKTRQEILQEQYQEVVSSWIGGHKNAMIEQYGPPTREAKLDDGSTVMLWEEYRVNSIKQWVCRKVFTADKDGRIVKGSLDGC